MKTYIWIAVGIAALAGCATQPFVSKAQIKQQAINNQLKDAIAYGKECSDSNADNPDVVLSYEQITVKGLNPPNRSELLASNKKLTAKQKQAYKNYLKLDNTCFAGVIAKLDGSPFLTLFQNAEALEAVNDANLLSGKITIGESNAKKIEIVQKAKSDLSALQLQLNTQFQQDHNAEAVVQSNKNAAAAAIASSGNNAAQSAINNMNTRTQIIQNNTTQQILQQSRRTY